MDKLKKIMNNPWGIVNVIFIKGLSKNLNDKKYLELMYRGHFKRKLDLENPQTFNEKLQWLKLYYWRRIYYSNYRCVGKF